MTFLNVTQRLLTLLAYGLAVAFVAGIVHLASIFLMPDYAPHDAYSRLAAIAKPGQTVLLPAALPGHALTPFEDPSMTRAVCLFDLSRSPVRIRVAPDPDALLTLSFRSRTGRVFYAMTDRGAVKGQIDIRILTAAQLEAVQAEDDEDNPPQELRLVAPQPQGFVLIRTLADHPSERAAAEARALAVGCAPEAIAQN